ncbi:MAG: hypothetical protein A2001_02335 [Treponema sp. GWC1_61_84]|nr:MAG: hypothetical protein A2001_02335 [Treponema sp. GWC1_61_84]
MLSDDEKKVRIEKNRRLEIVPEVPFLIEVGGFHGALDRYFKDDREELNWNVAFHKSREGVDDYGMPNIKPNLGIGIVAAAFGCAQTPNDEADPWIKARISEANLDAVHELALPDPVTNPVYMRAWERVASMRALSAMPLRMINVPSPLVTASLIWEYTNFIEALLVYPDEVHVLMDKITKATIAYVREQFRRIDNLHSVSHEMWYVPREAGVRISDDTAALLSPNLYREFGVKYNNEISRAFGGVVVHSCGDVQNVVAAMMEIEGLAGLDFTIPQNPNWDAVRAAAAGKTALYLRHYYWDHGSDADIDLADYSAKLLEFFGRDGLFIQTSTRTTEEARVLARELHRRLAR